MFFLGEDQLQLAVTKEPEITDVLNILAPYGNRWRNIGQSLNVEEGFLDGLLERHGMSDLERLAKVLQSWIETQCSEVSWNHIKEVLESPAVGKAGIAKKLSESLALFKLIYKFRLERQIQIQS